MSARPLPPPLVPEPAPVAPPERRRASRHATAMPVCIRTRGVKSGAALLLDLSIGGCRLGTAEWLVTGSFIMVTIGDFRAFDATVAWCKGGEAGLRFAWPLHAAILAHLLALPASEQH